MPTDYCQSINNTDLMSTGKTQRTTHKSADVVLEESLAVENGGCRRADVVQACPVPAIDPRAFFRVPVVDDVAAEAPAGAERNGGESASAQA